MDKSTEDILVIIGGPTASGKTALAIELARHFGCDIVSADSRQIFREMEIGTAKPTPQELQAATHHFINTRSITEEFSAGMFEREASELIEKLMTRDHMVIVAGGSGLYIQALTSGLDEMPEIDPEIREQLNLQLENEGIEVLLEKLQMADPDYYRDVDRKNPRRIVRALEVISQTGRPYSEFRRGINAGRSLPYRTLWIGLELEREVLYKRIEARMDQMIGSGLFEEAERLLPYREHPALQTVGYTEIFSYLDGEYDMEECIRLLKRNSRRYAKRQLTWFRNKTEMNWFNPGDTERIIAFIEEGRRS